MFKYVISKKVFKFTCLLLILRNKEGGGGVGISISILKHDFSEIEIEKIEKIEKIKNLLKSFFRLTQFTDQSIMFRLPLKLRIQEYNNLYVSLLLGHYR